MNNEEKILSLLEKLNNRIDTLDQTLNNRIDTLDQTLNNRIDTLDKTLNKRMDKFEGRMDGLENRMDNLASEVRKTNITIENDIKPKIEALFDGYKQNSDKLDCVINRLEIIEEKVETHDIHIKVLNKRKRNIK